MEKSLINPYEFLGVTVNSSIKELKKNYFELALICHPDKGGNDADMDILNKAYLYIFEQINNVDNVTYENLEENFQKFCNEQLSVPCPYSDIYNDFRNNFNNDFIKNKEIEEKDPFQDGYGDRMINSDITINSDYNEILNKTLNTKENIIIPDSTLVEYKSPEGINNNCLYHSLNLKKIKDFSTKNESDYFKAYTINSNSDIKIKYRSFEDIKKEREIFDINLIKSFKN